MSLRIIDVSKLFADVREHCEKVKLYLSIRENDLNHIKKEFFGDTINNLSPSDLNLLHTLEKEIRVLLEGVNGYQTELDIMTINTVTMSIVNLRKVNAVAEENFIAYSTLLRAKLFSVKWISSFDMDFGIHVAKFDPSKLEKVELINLPTND
jgi:AAA+ ATPase superfamily predicted ATPase